MIFNYIFNGLTYIESFKNLVVSTGGLAGSVSTFTPIISSSSSSCVGEPGISAMRGSRRAKRLELQGLRVKGNASQCGRID
jgi:hypothetical protein